MTQLWLERPRGPLRESDIPSPQALSPTGEREGRSDALRASNINNV